MINTYFLLYKGFSGYEMIFPAFILRNTNILTVGLEKGSIKSEESLNFTPDLTLSQLDIDHVDIFIIPGGSALQHLHEGSEIQAVLNKLHLKRKIIAAICGGPILFANTNILENKRFTAGGGELPEHWQKNFTTGTYVNDEIVIDDNLITAKGIAVATFAIEIGKKLGIFSNSEIAQKEYNLITKIK
ncbi:MAG: DJ-1/PfpI family protein [Candidatus Heimdallarchaeota archaeon]|nr:DJ-1/PfpI family protein [Candidatus Heimdallarchaeota archaeon]